MICGFLIILSLSACSAFHFLFITHTNELRRVTNTASLCKRNLPSYQTTMLIWKGRGCNDRLEKHINELKKKHSSACYLLFTDKWSNSIPLSSLRSTPSSLSPSMSTLYIILDSTWTEARHLYRKGPPILRTLPLLSIDNDKGSIYTLRRDFGFVAKFTKSLDPDSNNNTHITDTQHGNNLLCTAECVCKILEYENHGDTAAEIMQELVYMHSNY